MRINQVSKTNNPTFGIKFKLSREAKDAISKSTKLSIEELENLSFTGINVSKGFYKKGKYNGNVVIYEV